MLAVALLSRVPYDSAGRDEALIRLSWRTPGELVTECRRLTPEELERLPAHMRREEVCEGRMAPYRLRVTIDGEEVLDDIVRAAGVREDRPLYVYRELFVAPGEHRIEVDWEEVREGDGIISSAPGGGSNGRGTAQRQLTLDARVSLQSREITLVTYDLDSRVLVARGKGVVEAR